MKDTYTLVTGGAGYIGSHFLDAYLKRHDKVVILDNLEHGFSDAIREICKSHSKKETIFKKVDLRDSYCLEEIFEKFPISTIFHFAALCVVSESINFPDLYFSNNVVGSVNLLNAMARHGVKRLIFSSSSAVYGEPKHLPAKEGDPLLPVEPYGLSKYTVEKMLPWYERSYGIKYVVLRCANVCGADPTGRIGFSSRYKQNKLIQDAVKAVVGNQPLQLQYSNVDTPDGSPIRDYVDVIDIAGACLKSMKHLDHTDSSEVFNLGTGKGYSVKEVISKIESTLKVNIKLVRDPRRKNEFARVYISDAKARRVLGWKPTTPLEESIRNLANWYRTHPRGYAK